MANEKYFGNKNLEKILSIGRSNVVVPDIDSLGLGWANSISSNLGFALGEQNNINNVTDGYAFGRANVVDGSGYAVALGFSNTVTGAGTNGNFAIGTSNIVSGQDAFAAGKENTASGLGSRVIGNNLIASGISSTAIGGKNMTVSGNYSFGINLDDTTRTLSQNNTMSVMGGNVGIGILTPSSTLESGGSFATNLVSKTANYSLTSLDSIVVCTTNSFDITLPTAVGCIGRQYKIKNNGSGKTITMKTTGGETIDGSASSVLTLAYLDCMVIVSDGTNWLIM